MSSLYLTNDFWTELNASQFAFLKKLFSCWFEIIVVMCIKLVELCCSLSEYFEQIITGVLLCSNNKEADDGGLIQAFWPFVVFKSQASWWAKLRD